MSGFTRLLLRELKAIGREKTIMLAIIIQFFLASFSSILLIGIMSFYNPETIASNTKIKVNVGVIGNTESELIGFMRERNIRVLPLGEAGAERAFQAGVIDTIIYIPQDTDGVVDLKVILPEMDAMQTVILMVLKEPLAKYENYLRAQNGVTLHYTNLEGASPATYEFLYTIIIPILMLFPCFIAGSIVIDSVAEEIEHKTFDTLRADPIGFNAIFAAKTAAAILTALVQCVLWIVLLRFNDLIIQNVPIVLLAAFCVASFISFLAAVIALYFKDRERAQFAYSIVFIVLAGLSYFIDPAPYNLITRLAAGDLYVGILEAASIYYPPLRWQHSSLFSPAGSLLAEAKSAALLLLLFAKSVLTGFTDKKLTNLPRDTIVNI